MKKYIKLFLVAILTVFISIIPTYAKEVSLEIPEDGTERDTFGFIIGREQSRINYVYLIGEYAFTSAYKIDIQDVMLAANSIDIKDKTGKINTDPVFNEMTVYLFKPTISGGKITGWNKPEKIVGTTELPDKFNVKYIDYHYVKEDKEADTDEKVNTAMKKLTKDMFTPEKVKDSVVTVDIATKKLKESILKGMSSGVFSVLTSLVSDAQVNSVTFEYAGVAGVEPLTVDNKNLDIDKMAEWFENNKEKIFGKSKNIILADLLDKEFKATINLGETEKEAYVSKAHKTPTETYTVKFTGKRQEIDTNKIAKEALEALSGNIFEAKETEITEGKVKINIKKEKLNTKIIEGMGSGVYPLLQKLVNNNDVESVDFVYSGNQEIKYTLTKDLNLDDMVAWFEKNCETILGYKVEEALTVDLIDKSFTAHINLKNYAQKQNDNPDKYTISFDGELPEVDPDELLATVMNKVNHKYFEKDEDRSAEQNIVIKVKSIGTDIKKGMASGLYPALSEIAKNEGVQSVEFSYNGSVTYNLTKTEDLEKMAEWFEQNKKKIFGKEDKITLADLHEKAFTVKVDTGRVGKLKDGSKDTYTIKMFKTHDVTFHDEKANDPEKTKEVVTVYDGETIPQAEVSKRKKRDTETDKFLGWYEEIEEGTDKEEEFNFDETKITRDMELDTHWGKRLTKDEIEKLKTASKTALDTIHKDVMEVSVDNNVIKVVSHKKTSAKVGTSLLGAGVKTALSNFLSTSTIESITLSFNSYSETFTKNEVDNYDEFLEDFEGLFEKATGIEIYDYTWDNLKDNIDNIKVKINLKDDKVFEEGNGEYTFTLEIQPIEGE